MSTNVQSLFVSFFKPSIRVWIDWDRALKEGWPVKASVIEDHEALAEFYVSWYLSPDGIEVDFDSNGAIPLKLSSLLHSHQYPCQGRQEEIRYFVETFKKARQPIQLVVPAYLIGKSSRLLLDGNHRTAALLISRLDFRMMVFTIHGPLDSDALADLVHWLPQKAVG